MAAILKVWRHIRSPTPTIGAYLPEEYPAKFHPDSIWNDGVLRFFEDVAPTREQQEDGQD